MVSGGEDNVPVTIQIEIGRIHGRTAAQKKALDLGKDGLVTTAFAGNPRHGFEAGSTETSGLQPIGSKSFENGIGNRDRMAPASPLIKMPFGDPTLVVASAKETLLIATKGAGGRTPGTIAGLRGSQRLNWRFLKHGGLFFKPQPVVAT
jgi:hypothetical protein